MGLLEFVLPGFFSLLLWEINEEKKGLPIAFFVFSALSGAQATHASYDTDVLQHLLQSWKSRVKTALPDNHFEPLIAITDNDILLAI